MPLARANFYLPDCPQPGRTLLFNTFTGAVLHAETAAVRAWQEGSESLPDALFAEGVAYADPAAERAARAHWLEEVLAQPVLSLNLVTTLACNLGCPYCVEAGVKAPKALTEETTNAIIAWVRAWLDAHPCQEVQLNFYGGEPLLNPGAITRLLEGLAQSVDGKGIPLQASLITNGTLLRPEEIRAWKKLGLGYVLTTLDGPPAVHNRKRPLLDGGDSFRRITENLTSLADLAAIGVNVNFAPDNLASLPELFAYLAQAPFREGLQQVNLKPVFPAAHSCRGKQCTLGNHVEEWIQLHSQAKRWELPVSEAYQLGPCAALLANAFTIDPEGRLYRCASFLGHPELAVGTVFAWQEAYPQLRPRLLERCWDCPFFSLCVGGCRYLAWQAGGKPEDIACEERYFTRALPYLLRQHYGAPTKGVEPWQR